MEKLEIIPQYTSSAPSSTLVLALFQGKGFAGPHRLALVVSGVRAEMLFRPVRELMLQL